MFVISLYKYKKKVIFIYYCSLQHYYYSFVSLLLLLLLLFCRINDPHNYKHVRCSFQVFIFYYSIYFWINRENNLKRRNIFTFLEFFTTHNGLYTRIIYCILHTYSFTCLKFEMTKRRTHTHTHIYNKNTAAVYTR